MNWLKGAFQMKRLVAITISLLVVLLASVVCQSSAPDKTAASSPKVASRPVDNPLIEYAIKLKQPSTTRASRPAFKGMELYSWRDRDSVSWHFALLLGTNRLKSLNEVLTPAIRIDSVDELKRCLAQLAPGEHVFWDPSVPRYGEPVPAGVSFGYPDKIVIDELQEYCRKLGIELSIVPPK